MGKDKEGSFQPAKSRPSGIKQGSENPQVGGKDNIQNGGLKESGQRAVKLPEQLPGVLTKEHFTRLANYHSECCISLYLEKPGSANDNAVRFKTQLAELSKIMDNRGMSQRDIESLLGNAESLVSDEDFWVAHGGDQMAFFISRDVFKYMVITDAAPAERVFEHSFYVTPLLPMIRRDDYFYINVISKKGCRLYKADMKGIAPVPVAIPQEQSEVKAIPEKDDAVVRSMGTGNGSRSNIHGTDSKADGKTITSVFFEAIDDIFWKEVLHDETAPMLLAGVESVLPIYKSVTDYKNIWPAYLTGNREQQDPQDLYKEAMELMKPYFDERVNKALQEYGNKSATGFTSSVIADIIPAAYYSRIAVLFVKRGEHVWGKFIPDDNVLELAHTPDEGGEDLIDNAVTQTILNGGEVFLLDGEEMPADSQVNAIFRY